MHTVDTIEALRRQIQTWRRRQETVGFVPTMGNLHAGHLALVSDAQARADRVVVSIFVNPMQFGPGEDLDSYPRTLRDDQARLLDAGVDLLFAPRVETVYPRGEAHTSAVIVPDGLTDILCGASRPGHFRGVATVVAKLFNMVQPDLAVFGEKDLQQLRVIQRMAEDLDLPVRVHGSPTMREADGLATSSRNQYLSEAERRRAPILHQTLQQVAEIVSRDRGAIETALHEGRQALEKAGFQVDYLEVRDWESLGPPGQGPLVVLGAAWLGQARLIDNLGI
ncbi:pantoate--beta-alanine ligase [Natronospira proteinivora]|uniref:Pantothenate synthetase n=1 Tax=Natronospira proteinivora TaxID=1807133 RepID=A0ABT1G4I6_9GAMM|nr:pantoate--beta-alanine ligase [Natronospira proteinivora]MCP1726200.1 pantoate--beta-alanine ligase [Natronospira proteinivora]